MSAATLLYASGAFTLVLGIVHAFMPVLFDFGGAIPTEGAQLRPFRLWPIRYATRRSDVLGIAWVMNHMATYVLITLGVLDLTWPFWLRQQFGPMLALWIAGWWFVRAASQLCLGRRRGDLAIMVFFAALGVLHLAVAAW